MKDAARTTLFGVLGGVLVWTFWAWALTTTVWVRFYVELP